MKLGQMCDIVAGGTPPRSHDEYFHGEIPWVKIGDMLQGVITQTEEYITQEAVASCSTKVLPKDTLLISIFATIGRTAILGVEATTNQAIVGLVPKQGSNFSTSYLKYYLDYFANRLAQTARGVAQLNINSSILKDVDIPLPPLEEQKRIAAILDKADDLRRKRREAIAKLDSLLQSVFLEMFGDPESNPKGWRGSNLDDVCSKITDGTHQTPSYKDSGIPFVTVKNITTGKVVLDNCKHISIDEHRLLCNRVKPEKGDILVSKDGTIGVPCLIDIDEEFSIFVSVALLKPRKDKIHPIYLLSQIKSDWVQNQIRDGIKGIAIRHLHLGDFKKLRLLVPPLPVQEHYVQTYQKIMSIRQEAVQGLTCADKVFRSLQQELFQIGVSNV